MRKQWIPLWLILIAALGGCATPESPAGDCFPGPCAASMDLALRGGLPELAALTAVFVPKVNSEAYANDFSAGIWLSDSLRLASGSLEHRGPVKAGDRITIDANVTGAAGTHQVRTFATYTQTAVGTPPVTEVRAFELATNELRPTELTGADVSTVVRFPTNRSFEVQVVPSMAISYSTRVVASTDFAIRTANETGSASEPTTAARGSVESIKELPDGQYHVAFVLIDMSPYATPSRAEISIAAIIEDSRIVRLVEGRTAEHDTATGRATP